MCGTRGEAKRQFTGVSLFGLVDPRDQTQVVRHGNKCLYSLSNFAAPISLTLKELCFTDEKIAGRTRKKFIIIELTGIWALNLYLRPEELCSLQ